jgi:uncharacterized protein (DUF169 family)
MTTLKEFNICGEEIERFMLLMTSPIAIKMLKNEADIPEGSLRPKKDHGYHLAQCQAFFMSRRQGATVAMLKEDNWCWGPLIAYGLVDPRVAEKYDEVKNDVKTLPILEYGKYIGIVSAPLKTANFEPDIALIYSNAAQLNNMLQALSFKGEGFVTSSFYPTVSCGFAVVPALSGQYCITIPDAGEYGRALTGEDEIIFSVPRDKIEGLASQLRKFDEMKLLYKYYSLWETKPDFARPEFYKNLYREWGLDADDVPTWTLPWMSHTSIGSWYESPTNPQDKSTKPE